MKISLVHDDTIIGEIFPIAGSFKTREIKGLIIPTESYFDIRSSINKYYEIFHPVETKNRIDNVLNKILQQKFDKLRVFYTKIGLTINNTKISNSKSTIRIIDNLTNTGLGNPILNIESWNLETEHFIEEFESYNMDYKYPSSPNHVIEIKRNDETFWEY